MHHEILSSILGFSPLGASSTPSQVSQPQMSADIAQWPLGAEPPRLRPAAEQTDVFFVIPLSIFGSS